MRVLHFVLASVLGLCVSLEFNLKPVKGFNRFVVLRPDVVNEEFLAGPTGKREEGDAAGGAPDEPVTETLEDFGLAPLPEDDFNMVLTPAESLEFKGRKDDGLPDGLPENFSSYICETFAKIHVRLKGCPEGLTKESSGSTFHDHAEDGSKNVELPTPEMKPAEVQSDTDEETDRTNSFLYFYFPCEDREKFLEMGTDPCEIGLLPQLTEKGNEQPSASENSFSVESHPSLDWLYEANESQPKVWYIKNGPQRRSGIKDRQTTRQLQNRRGNKPQVSHAPHEQSPEMLNFRHWQKPGKLHRHHPKWFRRANHPQPGEQDIENKQLPIPLHFRSGPELGVADITNKQQQPQDLHFRRWGKPKRRRMLHNYQPKRFHRANGPQPGVRDLTNRQLPGPLHFRRSGKPKRRRMLHNYQPKRFHRANGPQPGVRDLTNRQLPGPLHFRRSGKPKIIRFLNRHHPKWFLRRNWNQPEPMHFRNEKNSKVSGMAYRHSHLLPKTSDKKPKHKTSEPLEDTKEKMTSGPQPMGKLDPGTQPEPLLSVQVHADLALPELKIPFLNRILKK